MKKSHEGQFRKGADRVPYINHPLLGDEVYGNVRKHPYKTCGQMLHAGILGFIHPVTGQYMEFISEPPKIYTETLEKLRKK